MSQAFVEAWQNKQVFVFKEAIKDIYQTPDEIQTFDDLHKAFDQLEQNGYAVVVDASEDKDNGIIQALTVVIMDNAKKVHAVGSVFLMDADGMPRIDYLTHHTSPTLISDTEALLGGDENGITS